MESGVEGCGGYDRQHLELGGASSENRTCPPVGQRAHGTWSIISLP